MIIRPARDSDAEHLAPLHVQVWNESYAGLMPADVLAAWSTSPMNGRVARWQDWIASGSILLAEDEHGRIVGFVGAASDPDDPAAGLEVRILYVVAELYGTGLGHRLLVAAIGDRPAHLWVFEGNDRAVTFYQRHGFVLDGGVREDQYGRDFHMIRP